MITVKKSFALAAATLTAATLTLGACSSNDDNPSTTSTTTTSSSEAAAPAATPTAAELNESLAKAMDPNTTSEEKASYVQGGEQAGDLFTKLSAAQKQSGATFSVVDPVLPGFTPDSVLATVSYSLPNQAARTIENVEFVNENGKWKLAMNWACTLAQNSLPADQLPAVCSAGASASPSATPSS